jgi:hypothetical protein
LAGDDFREYAHFAKTNAAMPAEGTLMEREIYRHLDRRNTREEHDALEQNRVMDLLNNAEENRNAEREKQAALKRAGLHHPTRQGRHAASVHRPNAATDGRSSFGKFKLEKAEVGTGKTGLSEHDLVKQTKTVEEDAIIESIAESTRNLLDN